MQADSPMSNNKKRDKKATSANKKDTSESPRCPQVADDCNTAPSSDRIKCQTDDDCTSFIGRKCCHDGCRLACLVADPPPPCTVCHPVQCHRQRMFWSICVTVCMCAKSSKGIWMKRRSWCKILFSPASGYLSELRPLGKSFEGDKFWMEFHSTEVYRRSIATKFSTLTRQCHVKISMQ